MPAPTIEAMPVAVRPTRPMLRTNLALAKAGTGPEHPRMVRARTLLTWFLLLAVTPALGAEAPLALTLERIIGRRPSLTGTSPTAPSWSPDGKLLAFPWNDRAMPERQVWV